MTRFARFTLKVSALALAGGMVASSAQAALAPNYQRARELSAVIEAAAAQLPTDPITKVIYLKPDLYQVVAGSCSLKASIVSKPLKGGMVGPRQFDVSLSKPRCKR